VSRRAAGWLLGALAVAGAAAGVWALGAEAGPLPAFKIHLADDGVYAVRFEDLAAAGLRADAGWIASRRLAVTNRGEPVPITVEDGGDGRFGPGDLFELVAEHPAGEGSYFSHVAVYNVYRLSFDGGHSAEDSEDTAAAEAASPATAPPTPAGPPIPLARHHLEKDRLLLRFGPKHRRDPPDPWYWARLTHVDRTPFRQRLRLPPAATAGETPVTLAVELRGWSYQPRDAETGLPDHRVELWLNDELVAAGEWDGQAAHRIEVPAVPRRLLRPGGNAIELRVPPRRPAGGDEPIVDAVALDWIEVSHAAGRALGETQERWELAAPAAEGDGAPLVLSAVAPPQVFAAGGRRLAVEEAGERRGGRRAFRVAMPAGETALWAVPDGALLAPAGVEIDRPSDLRRTDLQTDYLMIAHPTLRAAVEPLAALHRSRGLTVRLVDVDDVFDEFSHGIVDPRAIRDFLDFARRSYPPPAPRFVLLVGDASWDVHSARADDASYADWTFQSGAAMRRLRKNRSTAYAQTRPRDLVPTGSYFSDQGHAASDNWFVSLSPPSHFPDMAIGRFPVTDPEEAAAIVAKTIRYLTTPEAGGWRHRVLWVSERGGSPAVRRALPVSVISTTESAMSGTLASVAPYDSWTSASTPCLAKYRRVSSGYSVWTTSPGARSATDWAGEPASTASTTRIGRAVAFE
jgi:hypothetical protein